MKEIPVRVERVPIAGPRGEIEIRYVTKAAPARWRLWLAAALLRLAGRLAAMRVRVLAPPPDRGQGG